MLLRSSSVRVKVEGCDQSPGQSKPSNNTLPPFGIAGSSAFRWGRVRAYSRPMFSCGNPGRECFIRFLAYMRKPAFLFTVDVRFDLTTNAPCPADRRHVCFEVFVRWATPVLRYQVNQSPTPSKPYNKGALFYSLCLAVTAVSYQPVGDGGGDGEDRGRCHPPLTLVIVREDGSGLSLPRGNLRMRYLLLRLLRYVACSGYGTTKSRTNESRGRTASMHGRAELQ